MRERLRTDYAWTARQKQVLELIARGRSNTEIAEELGLSLAGAKWHVSEILSKLQADQREEAADYWRRYNGLAPRFERIFRGVAGALTTKWVAAGAAVLVAGAATAVIVAIAMNQSDEEPAASDADPPTQTPPPATPTPSTATVAPTVSSSVQTEVSIGPPVASIPSSIMYVVTGCTQCDGPDETLQKHVTDAAGNLTSTTLLASNEGVLAGWTVGQVAASPDGATLAVLACDQEFCGYLGPQRSSDTRWRVLLSGDQGLTWGQAHELTAEHAFLSDVVPHGFAMSMLDDDGPGAELTFVSYLSKKLTPLTPPAEVYGVVMRGDGSVLWITQDGEALLRSDGSPVPLAPPPRATRIKDVSELPDGTLGLAWIGRSADDYYTEILQFVRPDGTVVSTTNGNGSQEVVAVSASVAVGNMNGVRARVSDNEISVYPVLIDLQNRTVTPITADIFTQQGGRNRLIAFQSGPFARVTTGSDCLNIREQPSPSGGPVSCYRDGVLLRDLGETTEAGGITWLKVATPDGREGWASAEFLER
jgi:DNA-binding CsgD family transcriptional regulator